MHRSFTRFLFLSLCSLFVLKASIVFSQSPAPNEPAPKKLPSFDKLWKAADSTDGDSVIEIDDSDMYSMKWLRNDYRMADVVAYVEVTEKRLVDHTDGADCENDKGVGYCAYRLVGEVKEVFKGRITTQKLEFFGSSDADYPKKYFMGQHVVFLQWNEPQKGRKRKLGTMENSTLVIKNEVLQKLRSIVNPVDPIDEMDETNPYSMRSIKAVFDDSDAVILANVVSFRPYDEDGLGIRPFTVKARVKKSFKGSLQAGKLVEYKVDLLYRGLRNEDLGFQVLYLKNSDPPVKYTQIIGDKKFERTTNPRRVAFEQVEYTEGALIHGILEKLEKIRSGAKF